MSGSGRLLRIINPRHSNREIECVCSCRYDTAVFRTAACVNQYSIQTLAFTRVPSRLRRAVDEVCERMRVAPYSRDTLSNMVRCTSGWPVPAVQAIMVDSSLAS